MWLACDYHVTPCYSQPLLRMRAILMHYHAKTMCCHDNHMTCCILCAPKKVLDVYVPDRWGLGTRLHCTRRIECVWYAINLWMQGTQKAFTTEKKQIFDVKCAFVSGRHWNTWWSAVMVVPCDRCMVPWPPFMCGHAPQNDWYIVQSVNYTCLVTESFIIILATDIHGIV